jgi:WD40 repeat protein
MSLRRRTGERALASASEIYTLAFHPTGTLIAAGHYDGTVRVWSATDGQLLATLMVPDALVVANLAWSADGATLAANAWQGGAVVWAWMAGGPPDGRLEGRRLTADHLRALAFSPDGVWLLGTVGDGGSYRLWTVPSLREFAEVSPPDVGGSRPDAAFAPDARSLVIVGDEKASQRHLLPAGSPVPE